MALVQISMNVPLVLINVLKTVSIIPDHLLALATLEQPLIVMVVHVFSMVWIALVILHFSAPL
jgi:hypothetical protein